LELFDKAEKFPASLLQEVSNAPAERERLGPALRVDAVEISGVNHTHGFYAGIFGDEPDVTAAVESAFVRFFTQKL
jgi:hypothetical protein